MSSAFSFEDFQRIDEGVNETVKELERMYESYKSENTTYEQLIEGAVQYEKGLRHLCTSSQVHYEEFNLTRLQLDAVEKAMGDTIIKISNHTFAPFSLFNDLREIRAMRDKYGQQARINQINTEMWARCILKVSAFIRDLQ